MEVEQELAVRGQGLHGSLELMCMEIQAGVGSIPQACTGRVAARVPRSLVELLQCSKIRMCALEDAPPNTPLFAEVIESLDMAAVEMVRSLVRDPHLGGSESRLVTCIGGPRDRACAGTHRVRSARGRRR